MGARQKLNGAHVVGSLLLAGVIGWAFQSWLTFGVSLMVLIGLSVNNGEIRFARRRRH